MNLPTQGDFQAVKQWTSDLSERSVKDSLAHGKLNPYKNMAFADVKDVLENGVIIAKDQNKFKENSYFVAASALLNNQENILTVTVREDSTTRIMYIHSIMLKENLLKPRVSDTQENNSRKHIGSLTSADIHNILQQALTYNGQNSGSLKRSSNADRTAYNNNIGTFDANNDDIRYMHSQDKQSAYEQRIDDLFSGYFSCS